MIKYILVSKKFEGYLVLGYNRRNGLLVEFRNCSYGMTDNQMHITCERLGYMLTNEQLKTAAMEWQCELLPVDIDLSFERFYSLFDNPRNRFECEKLWAKLGAEEKQYIMWSVEAYNAYCLAVNKEKQWYNKVLPATFLRESWRSEWYKMIKEKKK